MFVTYAGAPMRRWLWGATITAVLTGCATAPDGADGKYRAALARALEVSSCPASRIEPVFVAYDRWFWVAAGDRGHYRGMEADVLLGQGEALLSVGCVEAARRSYDEVLSRFGDDDLSDRRAAALRVLQTLPPPYPLTGSPTRGT